MAAPAQARFRIDGMDCAACAAKIDGAVRRVKGVSDVAVSVTAGTMLVEHEAGDLETIAQRVRSLGYGIAPLSGAVPTTSARAAHSHDHDHDHHGHDHSGQGHGDHDHDHHHQHDHGHQHDHDHSGAAAVERSLHGHDHGPSDGPWWKAPKGRLTIAAGVAFAVAYGLAQAAPQAASWLFSLAMLVGLLPIARRAVMAARYGMPFTIETLMTIAAIGAVAIGAAEEGAMVVFLFLVGELLEGVAAGRARASIRALTALVPDRADRETGGGSESVEASMLSPGDVVRVGPGARIPADGTVLEGEGAVDEAALTGESIPVTKAPGASVHAGTINGDSLLRIRVEAAASDSTIARIVRLVEEAQERKAPMERFIDRFSRWYTPAVLAVGALVAILPPLLAGGNWGEWVYKGLAILLIGCPCALVISTPAAIAASLSAGARRGLLLKGGAVLEGLRNVTTIAFDKTGTLTEGKPVLTDVVAFGRSREQVLQIAAALEGGSSHPLAKAILAAAGTGLRLPVTDAKAIGGRGVMGKVGGRPMFLGSVAAAAAAAPLEAEARARLETFQAEGKTVSALVADGTLVGLLALRDEPRPDAAAALQALKARGIRTLMLTGDNRTAAEAIGRTLGIEVRAELLPQDKQKIVEALQAEGQVVAKVGDGINDAPALAAADFGIAVGGGTDVALETADGAILNGRVGDVAAMIDLSRRTMGNIRENITIALGLKAVFLATTLLGITGLWPAILADTGATVLVTLNALRLLRAR